MAVNNGIIALNLCLQVWGQPIWQKVLFERLGIKEVLAHKGIIALLIFSREPYVLVQVDTGQVGKIQITLNDFLIEGQRSASCRKA